MQPDTTIDEALDAFLEDQQDRLSVRTMRQYEYVVELLRDSLNGYAPDTLDDRDHKHWEKAFAAGDEEAFCHLFGPEDIVGHVDEFLGYFMLRKVIASQDLLRSAGTVTKKLATWLHERHYIGATEKDHTVARGADAARDLPRAERLANLLFEQSLNTPSIDRDQLARGDLIEDYLVIERVEPEALFFTGGVGPLTVSPKASALAEVAWGVNITLARLKGVWRVAEVGNVYPR